MRAEPLSETLRQMSAELPPDRTITLNEIINRTGARGPYALLTVLSLPFVTPVTLPGISNVIGVVMLMLIWRTVRGRPARLPKFAGNRPLQPERARKVLRGSARVMAFLEKWVKPRRTRWLAWRAARIANASVLALMALLLALPVPPTIPLSNTLPGYSIILLSMSLLEEDGWLIWTAYVVCAGTLIYLAAMIVLQAGAIAALYSRFFHRLLEWLH